MVYCEGHEILSTWDSAIEQTRKLIDAKNRLKKALMQQLIEDYYLLKPGDYAYNRSSMNYYPYGAIKRLDRYEEGILSALYICFSITNEKVGPVVDN